MWSTVKQWVGKRISVATDMHSIQGSFVGQYFLCSLCQGYIASMDNTSSLATGSWIKEFVASCEMVASQQ
jgi:hypothetical protein